MTYLTNHNSIETNDSELKEKLIIRGKRIPLFALIILTVILLICLVSPLIITVINIANGQDFNIGNIVFFILLWGGGFYILRLLLWNTVGKEYLYLYDKKILYVADYKFFKDGRQEIQIENLKIDIIHEDKPEKSIGRLVISNKTEKIETVFQTNIAELEVIVNKIKTLYN
jgi:hypothetical protein